MLIEKKIERETKKPNEQALSYCRPATKPLSSANMRGLRH